MGSDLGMFRNCNKTLDWTSTEENVAKGRKEKREETANNSVDFVVIIFGRMLINGVGFVIGRREEKEEKEGIHDDSRHQN